MASSYTTRKRLNKQGTGDNTSTWGTVQNSGVFDVADFALDGWTTLAVSADHTLTTADGSVSSNEAGARVLKLTTASSTYTQTLPAREGWYIVWNASTAAQTIACAGGGSTVSVAVGEVVFVVCDAVNIKRLTLLSMESNILSNLGTPSANSDACTKAYADGLALTAAAGNLPAQSGNAGKFLKTDGTNVSWADPLPTQTGNSGKFLQTNGTATAWAAALTTGAGLASVSGNTLTVSSASAGQVRTGTSTTVALTPGDTYNALAEVTLTYSGANIVTSGTTLDMAAFINGAITLTQNSTLPNPTNPKVGQEGTIRLIQDATGSRTLTLGSNWKRSGGAPTLTTTATATDVLIYKVLTATYILYDVKANPS